MINSEIEQFERNLKNYSNKKVLFDTLQLARGDDWEGTFTTMGRLKFEALKKELEVRLTTIGFLKA